MKESLSVRGAVFSNLPDGLVLYRTAICQLSCLEYGSSSRFNEGKELSRQRSLNMEYSIHPYTGIPFPISKAEASWVADFGCLHEAVYYQTVMVSIAMQLLRTGRSGTQKSSPAVGDEYAGTRVSVSANGMRRIYRTSVRIDLTKSRCQYLEYD